MSTAQSHQTPMPKPKKHAAEKQNADYWKRQAKNPLKRSRRAARKACKAKVKHGSQSVLRKARLAAIEQLVHDVITTLPRVYGRL